MNHRESSIQTIAFARSGMTGATIENLASRLTSRVDKLIQATIGNEWDEVSRVGREISKTGASRGIPRISQAANRLCSALDQPFDEWEVTHGVVRLAEVCFFTCGAQQMNRAA